MKEPDDLLFYDIADNVAMVVVGDFTDRPLKAYRDIPDKISTMVEGWLLEAWFRLHPGLILDDILDRMPNLNRDARGREKLRRNMTEKRTTFRLRARCISWSVNASQNAMKDRELQHLLLLPENHDCLRCNTTIDLEDRTIQELRQLKEETKASGKYGGSRRSHQTGAAQHTCDSKIGISTTFSGAQFRGKRLNTTTPASPISGDAHVELGKKRRYNCTYSAEEESSRAKVSKRQQQAEGWTSDWQTQGYGYGSLSTTYLLVEDEVVDNGGVTFPVDDGAQSHTNTVYVFGAESSNEEFQRQINRLWGDIPFCMESPGTAASGSPLSTRSSAIPASEMDTLSQDPGLSSSQGSDNLPAKTATPPSTMVFLQQWDPMFAGMYPAQGPNRVYEHGLF